MMTATQVTVYRPGGKSKVTITAPKDKGIVFDPGLLQHGVLSLGEFGPSGVKIAAFKEWDEAWFDAVDHGYEITSKS